MKITSRVIVLILSFLPTFLANAKTTLPNCFETSDLSDSEISITKYLCTQNDVVIPEEINGKKIIEISDHAFESIALRSASLPEGIIRIGKFSFYDTGLKTIQLPKTLKVIDDLAFWNNRIESINLPDGITKLGYGCFQINGLRSVVIPDSVADLGNFAFERNLLGSVTLSESLEKISLGAFNENRIVSLTIPKRVKVIEELAFSNNSLEKIVFPANLTVIGNSSFRQNYLSSIFIPESVKNIGTNAFDKNRLQSVEIPGTTFLDKSFSNQTTITRVGENYSGYWARYKNRSEYSGMPASENESLKEIFLSEDQKEYFIKETIFYKNRPPKEKIENDVKNFISPEIGRTRVDDCIARGGQFVQKVVNEILLDTCGTGSESYTPVPFGLYQHSVRMSDIYQDTLLINFGRK